MLVSASGVKTMWIRLKRFNVLVSCDIPADQGTAGVLLKIFLWGLGFLEFSPLRL